MPPWPASMNTVRPRFRPSGEKATQAPRAKRLGASGTPPAVEVLSTAGVLDADAAVPRAAVPLARAEAGVTGGVLPTTRATRTAASERAPTAGAARARPRRVARRVPRCAPRPAAA